MKQHGDADHKKRAKWCAFCKTYISYNRWKDHYHNTILRVESAVEKANQALDIAPADMKPIQISVSNSSLDNIDKILEERGKRYGSFLDHASITQDLKHVMHSTPQWGDLDCDMQEALDMIQHKIGRILNGDPLYIDSWVDIIGYAMLVENRLKKLSNEGLKK